MNRHDRLWKHYPITNYECRRQQEVTPACTKSECYCETVRVTWICTHLSREKSGRSRISQMWGRQLQRWMWKKFNIVTLPLHGLVTEIGIPSEMTLFPSQWQTKSEVLKFISKMLRGSHPHWWRIPVWATIFEDSISQMVSRWFSSAPPLLPSDPIWADGSVTPHVSA